MDSIIVFTPASLIELLSQIDELNDYSFDLVEDDDGSIKILVGESIYEIPTDKADDVQVETEVIDAVDDINNEAFDELVESDVLQEEETITSGIIKELIKTLWVGGVARLTAKTAKDMLK